MMLQPYHGGKCFPPYHTHDYRIRVQWLSIARHTDVELLLLLFDIEQKFANSKMLTCRHNNIVIQSRRPLYIISD